ncbi:heme lyase CcmF/NrfE family subunit [Methylococcus capsulatus]|jgi:cytochrome c-type biogenesis protein CcmF|uniref:Cytochrome c-type biogenesis protein CcmF n=1 Tax=Methylococcus capsulatus (strain ATCC 33009 / NCIMB 11132 / Bath) TaxID=243233 RepID=Q60BP7_METCA|nr:heme lyase CcmF/NrfE family subunit [Methylococcus capsulatus]AAU90422.1 cytochrome c-type biogenesis protein CcmF [Methylococcus capsulatus str. Bath]QXP88759.1 heme lyase CcmF/NrfE family subunit [Methylococcus capsulatus]QXP94210.1 heme lyase CcmF/NrfE family subunit [Methylococcus capsulatus]UQN11044.1 heme lyase CcmF/NrfE family subunit [Methylococcus capsulatus]
MIAELGHIALIMALLMALLQGAFPLMGASQGVDIWMSVAKPAGRAQFLFLLVSFGALTACFVNNDFSVEYVARNSNSALPLYYRIAAVWGSHEGSMLLWATILGLWTAAVTVFSRSLSEDFLARVLGIMGLVSVGILLFILFTSNPFERLTPVPPDGNDLNPLLQDFGMTVHPPMLYMGYVGLSVAFAFAIAALLGGSLDSAWARWSRPWTLVAWLFLTGGITLGSWWAYYELGWGGWWFWDPVENASFMPWLVATALIHSLAVTEKRGAFKAWTVLLAIFAFSLSLLGTFLVRSGVLTSVHAFASDPTRGLFILILLAIVVGGSLLVYTVKAPAVRDVARYSLVSKENLLLLNNILLVTASGSILLGTLYPLILDALKLGKISVGPPYFGTVFAPLMAPIFLLAGIGPMFAWRESPIGRILHRVRYLFPASFAAGIALAALAWDETDFKMMAGLGCAFWLAASACLSLWSRIRLRDGWLEGLRAQSPSVYGMTAAHLGVAVFLVGAVLSDRLSQEKLVRMAPGDSVMLAGYAFHFLGTETVQGPNFSAQQATFRVERDGESLELRPQKRNYKVQRNMMTEAAIDPGLSRDLYVALGEPLDGNAWSVRLYVKPFIRWIWAGGLFMIAGGILSVSDRRYRLPLPETRAVAGRAASRAI